MTETPCNGRNVKRTTHTYDTISIVFKASLDKSPAFPVIYYSVGFLPHSGSVQKDSPVRYQHHLQVPSQATARLAIAYKNFGIQRGLSHIGLGVAARNTAATLRQNGWAAEVWPLMQGEDLPLKLAQAQAQALQNNEHPFTHVVVSAPWIATPIFQQLCHAYPNVLFAVSSHSNLGFLQADSNGMSLLRDSYQLAVGEHNFAAAGNCRTYVDWVAQAYQTPCSYLPNLYDLTTIANIPARSPWSGGRLLLGCFGAIRPLKNLATAVGACIAVSRRLNCDTVIQVSAGRQEGHGILPMLRSMVKGLGRITLLEGGWQSWPEFRSTVAEQNLLLQMSFTESFNMVSADGVASGIATAASPAIEWLPANWHCDPDDSQSVADKVIALLHDPSAPATGLDLKFSHSPGIISCRHRLLIRCHAINRHQPVRLAIRHVVGPNHHRGILRPFALPRRKYQVPGWMMLVGSTNHKEMQNAHRSRH
jgi:glycosyltransferase involved in cell wall biosynthesis